MSFHLCVSVQYLPYMHPAVAQHPHRMTSITATSHASNADYIRNHVGAPCCNSINLKTCLVANAAAPSRVTLSWEEYGAEIQTEIVFCCRKINNAISCSVLLLRRCMRTFILECTRALLESLITIKALWGLAYQHGAHKYRAQRAHQHRAHQHRAHQ